MDKADKVMLLFGVGGIIIGYYLIGVWGIGLGAQLVWVPWFYYVSKVA